MDALITAAALALAGGDVLGALNRVALRNDAPALALRGMAMARLGDLERARALLRSAARAFGAREAVARARCAVAEAEIALVSRDLGWPATALDAARLTLQSHGDKANAAHAGLLQARRLLLIGRLDEAGQTLDGLDPAPLPPALRATHAMVVGGLAVRRLNTHAARAAFADAGHAAAQARIPALAAEVTIALQVLDAPAARVVSQGEERSLRLDEVEALLASGTLVIDACRYAVCQAGTSVQLASRPVLFALARALGEAWPAPVPRDVLVARAFRGKEADESYRARLRVEMGRLRTLLRPLSGVAATREGFVLQPHRAASGVEGSPGLAGLVVLAPPLEGAHGEVLALLSDGESWASSDLALALDASQRTVQRSLESLLQAGKVQRLGQGRSRRWMEVPVVPGFTTTLLLPASLPGE